MTVVPPNLPASTAESSTTSADNALPASNVDAMENTSAVGQPVVVTEDTGTPLSDQDYFSTLLQLLQS